MNQHMLRRAFLALRFFLPMHMVLLSAASCPGSPASAAFHERLKTVLAGTDRLVVTYSKGAVHVTVTSAGGAADTPEPAEKPHIPFEITDPKVIATIADTIILAHPEKAEPPCLCYGTHDIHFYKNGKSVLLLNYKHFSILGVHEEALRLDGEYGMTPESERAFAGWFEKQGLPDFQKGVEYRAAQLREKKERAERARSVFPDDFRMLIPEFSPIDPLEKDEGESIPVIIKNDDGTRKTIQLPPESRFMRKARERLALAKDKARFIQLCWEAIGREYNNEDLMQDVHSHEPLATMCYVTYWAADFSLQAEALEKAPATQDAIFAGAYWTLQNGGGLMNDKISDAMRARICSAAWTHASERDRWRVVLDLRSMSGAECMKLRLKIAAGGRARNKEIMDRLANDEWARRPEAESWLRALLDLSAQRAPEARAIVIDKLKDAPDGPDKLALEVALACYDGPGILRAEHYALEDLLIRDIVKSLRKSPMP
jgi:hypothetical protein